MATYISKGTDEEEYEETPSRTAEDVQTMSKGPPLLELTNEKFLVFVKQYLPLYR